MTLVRAASEGHVPASSFSGRVSPGQPRRAQRACTASKLAYDHDQVARRCTRCPFLGL